MIASNTQFATSLLINFKKKFWNWRTFAQLIFLAIAITCSILAWNTLARNMRSSGLAISFDFLNDPASFDIADTPFPYKASDSYTKALQVGLINSLKAIAVSIVSATVVGVTVGISRLSSNWLVKQLALVYVEILRNTPLLLQLFFWYSAIFLTLPAASASISLGFATLAKDGITIGALKMTLSSEFCALVLGLTMFSSAFIAEIVRGGILSVPKGQSEAARALGLSDWQTMRKIVLPQALRVIIPSLTSQYVNIAKNSSLAIAIGYTDVYRIASTTINQTGRPVNVILIIMAVYLAMSLTISASMNLLNRQFQIVER
ncbi:amino acid ABC transporter permease [Pseudanabaena mucicola]|uniref:ABC transporter permease subunit n=1 Tax=Pseudanabaena mucicola FACHB-723 TaxID=2692860 RepID=A0ABR7ZTS1_9CYAN|nr:ABC transporter permease subunit [Pseudanabaena mucicola]MBD2187120.1 ABC transporter permease subunit [Pseudanabaena mucicola FACHB-723]